ncbi:MAG: LysR substrate-binding domain-containing protein [Pseudomonadota bacterium]
MPFPDIRLPSLDSLRAFEAVARLGTLERAAEALHISASAVSKRLSGLEELLDTRLLVRTGKVATLTPSGQDYLTHVRAALDLLAAVPLHQRTPPPSRRLRVVSPPTFARQILVPQLSDFTAQHPDTELEVVLSIPQVSGPRSEADVEVRHGPELAGAGQVLMRDVVVPVASPSLLARLKNPICEPADLWQAPLLRTPLEPWSPWFAAAGLPQRPEPSEGPNYYDLGLILEAAVGGQGIALARPSLARHWLASGALQVVLDIEAEPAWAYHGLLNTDTPQALGFMTWLSQCCQRVAAEALAELRAGRALSTTTRPVT